MNVDEEVDGKIELDLWKKDLLKQMNVQMCRRRCRACSKKHASRSCKKLSKDGMISCRSIKRCRRGRKKLESLQD